MDDMDDRLVYVGNAIEVWWFLTDIGDSKLIQQAFDISIRMLDYG